MKILVINGANLNLLGRRQPEIYGRESFEDYLEALRNRYPGHTIDYYQSNIEGELVDAILLTGGIAWNDCVNDIIVDYCKFLAPIKIYPGENELESLAENALRVLKGETTAKEY